jgi:predicted ABC-type ATPase
MRPVLIVIAGPNGSGKTSLTRLLHAHDWAMGCTYINPDDIARNVFGDWNSMESTLKAANYAEEMRERLLAQRESIAFETVMSTREKVDFIRRAKDAGYFVRVFFVGTKHPAINASRVAMRVMDGGHDVPIGKIISRYFKSVANYLPVAKIADRTYVYDNSVDNRDPLLVFRTRNGEISKVYHDLEPGDWTETIKIALGGSEDMRLNRLRPGKP